MSTNLIKSTMKSCLLGLIILTSVFSLRAQAAPDASEITNLLNEFLAGAGRNDAAVHERFWAEDLIYTRSAGTRTGKEVLMKGVRNAPPSKPGDPVTVYSADDVRIQQYGNTAVVAFKLVGNTTRSDGSATVSYHLNTGTFVKRNGKWQVVAWQATIVPKAEPKPEPLPETPKVESKPAQITATENPISQGPEGAKSIDAKKYEKGSRGGCFYLNTSGKKVYVDHSKCQ